MRSAACCSPFAIYHLPFWARHIFAASGISYEPRTAFVAGQRQVATARGTGEGVGKEGRLGLLPTRLSSFTCCNWHETCDRSRLPRPRKLSLSLSLWPGQHTAAPCRLQMKPQTSGYKQNKKTRGTTKKENQKQATRNKQKATEQKKNI